jgi:F-box-like
MHKAPNSTSQKDLLRIINKTSRKSTQPSQYGQHPSYLLLLPSESLTHITSFLDPGSLISLEETNRKLYRHVHDDNTWRRAFVYQFLGVSPENAVNEVNALTFRLTEKTWRREFLRRHAIRG